MTTRQATHITQVVALTKDFLKEAGKENLTKRHVLAFLQQRNLPQYLSSDIIRCLKLSHDIHVKDVLDEFPVARTAASRASHTSIMAVRQKLINLECERVLEPEVASVLRRCAASLTRTILDMEKLELDSAKTFQAQRMAGIHASQACSVCRHFSWTAEQMPVKIRDEIHHPACRAVV